MPNIKPISDLRNYGEVLRDFPLIGTPLSAIVATQTDYCFFGCGSYLAFCRPQNDDVLIDRVLHGRQNYVYIH